MANRLLAKCAYCGDDISLDQKSLRYQNKWVHASCLKFATNKLQKQTHPISTKNTQPQKRQLVFKTKVLSEGIYTGMPPVKKHVFTQQQIRISSAKVLRSEKNQKVKEPEDKIDEVAERIIPLARNRL